MLNELIIKKCPFETEVYPKPLKVTTELHAQVRKISGETNLPIHKVACMLVSYALAHVKIEA
jgi:hypothetical protein